MFSSVDSVPCFEFTFRAVNDGNTFIDDPMNVDKEPLLMDNPMGFGESIDIDDPMDVDPPKFALSVVLGTRRYARVASCRLHRRV
ncbi:hypothetical protein G6F56_009138 [Rhizopus delemar]|nr:hypothetical protein G6F56_009138 [Rhizopus delemar]